LTGGLQAWSCAQCRYVYLLARLMVITKPHMQIVISRIHLFPPVPQLRLPLSPHHQPPMHLSNNMHGRIWMLTWTVRPRTACLACTQQCHLPARQLSRLWARLRCPRQLQRSSSWPRLLCLGHQTFFRRQSTCSLVLQLMVCQSRCTRRCFLTTYK
jgi:hypothetical protein